MGEKKAEFKALKVLPFQVQISYFKKDGSRMLRGISQTKEITLERQKVRNNLEFDVMARYGQHVTTELCAKGDYESARAWTSRNMKNNHQMFALANYAQQNVALDHQMQQQMQVEQMDECANGMMDDSFSFKSASKKRKGKKRKAVRNDKFSSAMYSMKSKARGRK